MDGELVSIIIFYSIIGFLIYKTRAKIEIMDKVFFVYKWKKGVEYIKKLVKPEWFWKIISTLSIPVCFFFIVFSIDILLSGALSIISAPEPTPTVSLLIPGVTTNPATGEVFPVFQTILVIIILAVVHEGGHGVISLVEKIKLKTTGFGLLLILPLAFVEPDQKSFMKASRLSRIRMLCAGSFSNLTLAFLAFLTVIFIFNPVVENMVEYTNVLITETIPGEPAELAGIPNNSVLLSINDKPTNNMTTFIKVLLELTPGDNISVLTSNGTFHLTTLSNPINESIAYLGVLTQQEWEYKQELLSTYPLFILSIPLIITQFLMLLSNLNFAIGIFNLFPLWITDGGKIVIDMLSIIIKNKRTLYALVNTLFLICLGILLFNMLGPYFINSISLITSIG